VTARAIIYTSPYHLGGDELAALVKAMATLGENSFYLTVTEDDREPTWLVPGGSVEEYGRGLQRDRKLFSDVGPHVLENVIYSCRGTWGIWLDQEGYGYVGSTSHEFLDTLLANYPPIETGIGRDDVEQIDVADAPVELVRLYQWLCKTQRQRDFVARWMIQLLDHMYGEHRSREILQEASWE
jgi:hypothetical protein